MKIFLKIIFNQLYNILYIKYKFLISILTFSYFKIHYFIISTIFGANSDLTKYYLSIISAQDDFFDRAYKSILNSDIRPEVVTNIRFRLQEMASANDQIETGNEND